MWPPLFGPGSVVLSSFCSMETKATWSCVFGCSHSNQTQQRLDSVESRPRCTFTSAVVLSQQARLEVVLI